jgi:hypothetical protein
MNLFKNLIYASFIILLISSCRNDLVSLTSNDLMTLTAMKPNAAVYDSILNVHNFNLVVRDTSTRDDGSFFMNSAYVNSQTGSRVTIYNESNKENVNWLTEGIEFRTSIRSHNEELMENFESAGFKKVDKYTFKYKDFEVQNIPVDDGTSFLYTLNISKDVKSK